MLLFLALHSSFPILMKHIPFGNADTSILQAAGEPTTTYFPPMNLKPHLRSATSSGTVSPASLTF